MLEGRWIAAKNFLLDILMVFDELFIITLVLGRIEDEGCYDNHSNNVYR